MNREELKAQLRKDLESWPATVMGGVAPITLLSDDVVDFILDNYDPWRPIEELLEDASLDALIIDLVVNGDRVTDCAIFNKQWRSLNMAGYGRSDWIDIEGSPTHFKEPEPLPKEPSE